MEREPKKSVSRYPRYTTTPILPYTKVLKVLILFAYSIVAVVRIETEYVVEIFANL